MNDWYSEIDTKEDIGQGDILFDCPIVTVKTKAKEQEQKEVELDAYEEYTDVIVLSQACDLANNKLKDVLVAELVDLPKSQSEKQDINDLISINRGHMPRYHLLKEKTEGEVLLPYRLINFSSIFTIPKEYLNQEKDKRKGKRITLNSPYKEFVSQRFGAFFARIGLPIGITDEDIKRYYNNLHKEKE